MEELINNFGGMLQVLIVKLTTENLDANLSQKIFETLQTILEHDQCRSGVLLILNGVLNTLDKQSIKSIQESVLDIVEKTVFGGD